MRKVLLTSLAITLAAALVSLPGCGSKQSEVVTSPKSKTAPSETSTVPPISTVPTTGQKAEVIIQNLAFQPGEITVKVGTTVWWDNKDTVAHTITGPDWDSGQIFPNMQFIHTFTTPGTIEYRCTIHPQMTGRVIVQ